MNIPIPLYHRFLHQLFSAIKQFDAFGVPLQLSIQNKNTMYQSLFGGSSTILIYLATIYYFVYMVLAWQTRSILPQVNVQTIPKPDGDSINIRYQMFKLNLAVEGVDPQDQQIFRSSYLYNQSTYYYGKQQRYINSVPNKDSYDCQRQNFSYYYFSSVCQNLKREGNHTSIYEQTYLYQDQSFQRDTFIYYSLQYCETKDSSSCMDRYRLTNYTSSQNIYWELKLTKQDVNVQTGQIYEYESGYYFYFTPDATKFLNIQLKVTKAVIVIDDGPIFSRKIYIPIIKDVEALISYDDSYEANQGPQLVISMEKYQQLISITYLKVPELMAQTLSLMQTLIMLGFFINVLNSYGMHDFTIDQLVRVYFPSYKNYEFVRTLRGRYEKVLRKGLRVDEQLAHHVRKTRHLIAERVQDKLNIFNIISELNKVQLAVSILLPEYTQWSDLQYRLSFEQEQFSDRIPQELENLKHFDERDFLVHHRIRPPQDQVLEIYAQLQSPKGSCVKSNPGHTFEIKRSIQTETEQVEVP